MRRWLRLDAQWDDTEWVMLLGPMGQLAWIKLLCYVKRDGRRGAVLALSAKAAAKKWDVPVKAVEDMVRAATDDGALSQVEVAGEGLKWVVTKWKEYQEPDKTAAQRKRDQREREREEQECHGSHGGVTGVSRRDPVARDHRPPTPDKELPYSEAGGVENSGPAPPVELDHSHHELLEEANTVLGLGILTTPAKTSNNSVLVTWDGVGISRRQVYAAIHGLRMMVERQDPDVADWLKPGEPIGLKALRNTKGKITRRELIDVAAEYYERHADPPAPPPTARTNGAPMPRAQVDISKMLGRTA